MDKFTQILDESSNNEKLILKKWHDNYIVPLNKDEISWLDLNSEELQRFLNDNYYDNECNNYVGWYDSFIYGVFGMRYLGFGNIIPGFNYLIGIIPNNINKFTIVASLCYCKDYIFELGQVNGVNWIQTVETNYFYKNNGLFKMISEVIPKSIDFSKDLIMSEESIEGFNCHIFDRIKNELINCGFEKEVLRKNDNKVKKLIK